HAHSPAPWAVAVKAFEAPVEPCEGGRAPAKALAGIIEGSILPAFAAAATRVDALQNVPPSQQPLVAGARVYLRLRDQSWRLRAEALRKANMAMLRQADSIEYASLTAFRQIGAADGGPHP